MNTQNLLLIGYAAVNVAILGMLARSYWVRRNRTGPTTRQHLDSQ